MATPHGRRRLLERTNPWTRSRRDCRIFRTPAADRCTLAA